MLKREIAVSRRGWVVYECRVIEIFCPEQMKHLAASLIMYLMLLILAKLRIKIEHLYTPSRRKRPLNYFSDCEFN